jgi:tetratricopeptide (TPR) repeat protein
MSALDELDVERNLQATIDTLRSAANDAQADVEAMGGKLSAAGRATWDTLNQKLQAAEEYFARALDSKELYDTLAAVARAVGDDAGAAHFTKQGNTFLADELEFKGRLQAFYGNNTAALAKFKEALALVPDHGFSLKGAEASAKRVEKAKKEMAKLKANTQAKGEAKDWVAYGSALADLGDLEGAGQAYDKALSVDPKNPDALARKGTAIHAAGDPAKALEWYKKALEVKPTSMTGRRGVNYATFQIEHPGGK